MIIYSKKMYIFRGSSSSFGNGCNPLFHCLTQGNHLRRIISKSIFRTDGNNSEVFIFNGGIIIHIHIVIGNFLRLQESGTEISIIMVT